LLEPLEEQFDLPSIFVNISNRFGSQMKIVGKKKSNAFRYLGLCNQLYARG
jgi:hypothetical protein